MEISYTAPWQRGFGQTAARRRVEKANKNNGLNLNLKNNPGTDHPLHAERETHLVSQSGTRKGHDDVSNLAVAAFAAQVIGQVLETNKTFPPSVARAYEAALRLRDV